MSVREYVGARYVPLFADPILWDITQPYEPLTVVMDQGTSYVSKQSVPPGIDIQNEAYWLKWADYNAQIEAYRQEVLAFDGRIDALEDKFDADGKLEDNLVITDSIEDGAVTNSKLAANSVASANIIDGTIATADIANSAITGAKIANATITPDKLVNEDKMLIFGDSWTNFNSHPDWATKLCDILRCTPINYGVSGATFTADTNNLVITQINSAIAALSTAEKAKVRYIVVMAGTNDHSPKAPADYYTDVKTALVTLNNSFPNAVIQWFPTSNIFSATNGWNKLYYNVRDFWICVQKLVSQNSGASDLPHRIAFPKCGPCFWFGATSSPTAYFADGLHINDYGKDAIVEALLDGFGVINVEWMNTYFMTTGNTKIVTRVWPTDIKLYGQADFSIQNPTFTYDYVEQFTYKLLAVYAARTANALLSDFTIDNATHLFAITPWINPNNAAAHYSRITMDTANLKCTLTFGSQTSGTIYA